MKKTHLLLPQRVKWELALSLVLVAGIIAVLLIPTNRRHSGSPRELFTIVESDYLSPLFSSATGIRLLNGAAKQIGQFAGYDDFQTRLAIDDQVAVVNVTRFTGDLPSMLNLQFILRDPAATGEPCLYLSENSWERLFGRSPTVLSSHLTIQQVTYRIAGVIRGFHGLLDSTDLWMPVRSRGCFGNLTSMKILGCLTSSTWQSAQKEFARLFHGTLAEKICPETDNARLLPISPAVQFREELNPLAANIRSRTASRQS